MQDIGLVTYIVPEAQAFPRLWPILKHWFGDIRPASTMLSAGLIDPAIRIEIEVTARRRAAG